MVAKYRENSDAREVLEDQIGNITDDSKDFITIQC
jgi:hypothetical protein